MINTNTSPIYKSAEIFFIKIIECVRRCSTFVLFLTNPRVSQVSHSAHVRRLTEFRLLFFCCLWQTLIVSDFQTQLEQLLWPLTFMRRTLRMRNACTKKGLHTRQLQVTHDTCSTLGTQCR